MMLFLTERYFFHLIDSHIICKINKSLNLYFLTLGDIFKQKRHENENNSEEKFLAQNTK